MTPETVIVAATREAAKLIRVADVVGTLEPGKVADLLVVDGNPVSDIRVLQTGVRMVVQAGVVRRDDLGLASGKAEGAR
jgi:imidazolonepropionase-like amidohydrolase